MGGFLKFSRRSFIKKASTSLALSMLSAKVALANGSRGEDEETKRGPKHPFRGDGSLSISQGYTDLNSTIISVVTKKQSLWTFRAVELNSGRVLLPFEIDSRTFETVYLSVTQVYFSSFIFLSDFRFSIRVLIGENHRSIVD